MSMSSDWMDAALDEHAAVRSPAEGSAELRKGDGVHCPRSPGFPISDNIVCRRQEAGRWSRQEKEDKTTLNHRIRCTLAHGQEAKMEVLVQIFTDEAIP